MKDRLLSSARGDGQPALLAHLLMLLWVLLVGGSFPLAATLDEGLSPFWLTVVRFLLAAGLMLPWVLRRPDWFPRQWRSWVGYGLLGLCLASFFSTQFMALNLTSALSVASLFVSLPLLTWLLASLAGIERSGWRRLLLLVIGALGALGLVLRGSAGVDGFGPGEWLFLGGCVGSALYTVASRWLVVRDWLRSDPLLATFWSLVIGALLIVPLALLQGEAVRTLGALWDLSTLGVFLALALFASFLTFWILQRAVQVLLPSSIAAYCYLTPLVSLLLSVGRGEVGFDRSLWLSLALLSITVVGLLGVSRSTESVPTEQRAE